jgi:hypothetical protein
LKGVEASLPEGFSHVEGAYKFPRLRVRENLPQQNLATLSTGRLTLNAA